jgi:AAA+ ATPase superfamily predicted ATPase
MMMKNATNPFPTTSYIGPEYFCDRASETKRLLNDLTNGQSVTLTSVRRIGKTGLIRHVINQLPSSYHGIYTDILTTENLNGFFNALCTAALNAIPETSSPGKKLWRLISAFRPVISIDQMTGLPQISVDFKPEETNKHIGTILKFLEQQPKRVIVAIDEFQQILHYPEKNTDAWLRSVIQTLTNVNFIFSGSQQHLMMDLFSNPSRPFYRSTGFMKLNKIPADEYIAFIIEKFREQNRNISEAVAGEIIEWTQGHTYYVQLLCNRVFRSGARQIKKETWMTEAFDLLKEQEMVFINYRDLLTNLQWQLLKAIASEEKVSNPTSKEFIAKYNLGSPSTVLRSLNSLTGSEMIYKDYAADGKSFHSVYDILFQRWVQNHIFNQL